MLPIKVATASLNQTPLDWAGNQARIEAAIRAARAQEVSLLVLPELCTTGYGCEDAFLGPDVANRAWAMLMALLPQTNGMVLSVGMPVRRRGGLYNTACVVADGRISSARISLSRAGSPASLPRSTSPGKAFTTSRAGSSRGRTTRSSS